MLNGQQRSAARFDSDGDAMIRMHLIVVALASCALISSCGERKCSYFGTTGAGPENGSFEEITISANPHGAAFGLHMDAVGQRLDSAAVLLWIGNAGDADCQVAIYTSSERPVADQLPLLDPTAEAPATVPTLGTRQTYFDLARNAGSIDVRTPHLEFTAQPHGKTDIYLTVATCAAGGINLAVDFSVVYCDDTDHVWWEYRELWPSTSSERLW